MNRIKVLLTAVGVLAIVGSALAYSGSFDQKICFVTRPSGGCTTSTSCGTGTPATGKEIQVPAGQSHCYKIMDDDDTSCSGQICSSTGTVVNN